MEGYRRVKFNVAVTGECWAHVPDTVSDFQIGDYLMSFGAVFGGNKLWNIDKVCISEIEQDD